MFGAYRAFLAMAVVIQHLLLVPVIGQYAVHGFFILSGYLMTYVMQHTYGYSWVGYKRFGVNRFLRLYPAYWAILSLSLVIILILGEDITRSYRRFIYLPSSAQEWFQNLSLLYFSAFPGQVEPRFSPPTWALTIELIFYVLIMLGISKNRQITWVWFYTSALYMALTHIQQWGDSARYSSILAGSLPFAVGALIYHYRQQLETKSMFLASNYVVLALLLAFIINAFLAASIRYERDESVLMELAHHVSFYLNYMVNALLVVMLIKGRFPLVNRRVDGWLGDLSYPTYLFHWLAGLAVSMMIWGEPLRGDSYQGIITFVGACLLCVVLSVFITYVVDRPLKRVRAAVKASA